jgi:hypothetical protein
MKSKVVSCIVTGIEKRVSGATLEKKSLKFGNLEQFERHFVCNEAKKLLRDRLQPSEVQEKLRPSYVKPFTVDLQVLARLKLLKKPKTDKAKANGLIVYNPSEPKQYDSLKSYVEEMTGGKDRCQVPRGGTCIRPDVYYDNEFNKEGRCSPCPYNEHCLCTNREVV